MFNNFNRMIKILLIVILVVCLFFLIRKEHFEPSTTNSFKEPSANEINSFKKKLAQNALRPEIALSECKFDPTKISQGFGTILSCKDYCNNSDNNSKFGGVLCNEAVCETLCNRCTDTQLCRWNNTPVLTQQEQVPEPIELEYILKNNEIILRWEKPESETPLSHYCLAITREANTSKLEIEVNNDVHLDFVEHITKNLHPDSMYFIEVYTRNRVGYSEPSNKIKVKTAPSNSSGNLSDIPEDIPEEDQSFIEEFKKKLEDDMAQMKTHKDIDLNSPLSILTQDQKRDSQPTENLNLEVFFN